MTAARRVGTRLLAGIALVAVIGSACSPSPVPTPSPASTGAAPSASPAGPLPSVVPSAGDLALEACDLTGHVPCEHQAALLAVPVTGAGVTLTYSSEWATGRKDRTGWDAGGVGLGGWALDVLQRYDAAAGVLLSGDGSWRLAKGIVLATGERVVPSYDGRLAYVFDPAGRHVRTVDALLGITLVTFSYDAAGRLAAADGSLDGTPVHLVVEREADGALSGLVGSNGARTALFLDAGSHLGGVRDPAGRATVIETTPNGLVTRAYDPTGGVTAYAYDEAGRVVSTTDPDGVVVTLARTVTADAIEIRTTTALGRAGVHRSERSATGRVQSYTAPDGTRTTVSTDAAGGHAITLADGTAVAVGAQPDPRWGMDAPVGTPVDITRPDGVTRHHTTAVTSTAAAGDPLAVSAWSRIDDVAGGTWTETADPASRTITWSDPAGRKTIQGRDTAGRLVAQVEPGQPSLALAYDDLGRLVTSTSGSGASAAKTSYAYGIDGVVTITGPDGVVEQVTFDAVGQIVRWSSADGGTTLSAYDGLGRLVRVAPAGQPSTTIGRSAAGRQTGFLPPTVGADGTYEARTYDKDGNLVTVAGPGDRAISYTFDDMGRTTGWTFDGGAVSAAYDPATGLLSTTSAPGEVRTQLSYSGGTPIGRTLSGPVAGAVTETLDAQGRVAAESVNGAAPIARTYDAAGLLASVGEVALLRDGASGAVSGATLGVVRTTREYDPAGRPVRIVATAGGAPAIDVRYGYDLRGRVTSVTETRAGTAPVHTTYGYDASGRLASVTVDGTAVERDGYDAAGNRVLVRTPGGTLTAGYDDRSRLVHWGPAQYTFRPDGQLSGIEAAGTTTGFGFDDFGNLRRATLPDGRLVTYLLDAAGNRVGKQVDGVLVAGFLHAPDGRIAAETDAAGAVVARFGYDDAGRLTLIERGAARYQVVTDHLGSPLLVIDAANGAVAEAITYDAWGAVTSDTRPGFLPIGFAGGLRDLDTGLVTFGARQYDPRTGRWTGPDPIGFDGGDPLLYRYVAGDPVNRTDPTGLRPAWESRCVSGDPMCGGGVGGPLSPYTGPPPGHISNEDPHCGYFCPGLPPDPGPPLKRPIWERQCPIIGTCPYFGSGGCLLGPAFCQWGEPHEVTGDGVRFGFQAAGEFVLAESPDRSVIVQTRMEPYGTSTLVTLATAIAVSVAGDRVAVYASDAVPLTIGGTAQTRADLSVRLPHGGIVERHGPLVTITWPGGSRLGVTRSGGHLDFSLAPDAATAPTLRGLLGNRDGNPANDLTTRDGTVIDPNDPGLATKIYDPFGASWRITQAESLFDYAPGESTATFTKPGFPHGSATIDSLDPATRSRAEAMCRALGISGEPTLADCILDVGTTGDSSYAASAAAVQVGTATAAAGLPGGGAPPFSSFLQQASGAITRPAQVDRTTFAAKAGDVVYVHAKGPCANGVLWRLVGPSGTGDLSLGHACDDLGRFVLPEAGTYAVEVYTDTDGATGAYAFDILGAPVERVSALTFGRVVSDSTVRIGEWHEYTFEAKVGDVVVLDSRSGYVPGLLWALTGPSGRLSLGNIHDDLGRFVLPAAGVYAVEIYADGTATGPYSFLATAGS